MTPPPIRLPFAARLLVAAVVALVGGACGATSSRNPFVQANPAETRVTLFVENRGFNDVRVYAITPRGSESLGGVGGNTQRRIDIAWRQLDQLSFRIEVLAGRTYNTPAVSVSPGDRVHMTIPDDPSNVYIQVR